METIIKIKTEKGGDIIELEIDNSTNFKNLSLSITSKIDDENSVERHLSMSIDKVQNTFELNGIEISGIALQLFKEFVNQ